MEHYTMISADCHAAPKLDDARSYVDPDRRADKAGKPEARENRQLNAQDQPGECGATHPQEAQKSCASERPEASHGGLTEVDPDATVARPTSL